MRIEVRIMVTSVYVCVFCVGDFAHVYTYAKMQNGTPKIIYPIYIFREPVV